MSCILYFPKPLIYKFDQKQSMVKQDVFSNCVNFWTHVINLFLEIKILFGTWYEGGLSSLMLCKPCTYV
jgi:hypothetical protein